MKVLTVLLLVSLESIILRGRKNWDLVRLILYELNIDGFSAFLVFTNISKDTKGKSNNISPFDSFKKVFADIRLLNIIKMHKDVAIVTIHHNKSIIFFLIEEFESPIIPHMAAFLRAELLQFEILEVLLDLIWNC